MNERDDYLWDRTGPPDPEVERLERLLSPLGRCETGRDDAAPPAVRRVRNRLPWFAAAAAVLVAAAIVRTFLGDEAPTVTPPTSPDVAVVEPGPTLHVEGSGDRLAAGAWVETKDTPRELVLGDVGRIRVDPGSRLQVRRLADETTRLYLARGRLEASVSADARPRFFQVDTDAARCVDLGCRYTLSVDEAGVAHVAVTTGQVAFESGGREVYVPSGAECLARPGTGPGTPRFLGTSQEVAAAFDAYDTAKPDDSERRRALALAALATVRTARDTLAAWHLLQDADPAIVDAAAARLDRVTSGATVAGLCRANAGPQDRIAWKEYLEGSCW